MRRLYVVQSQPRFEAEKDAPEDTNLGHHLATMLSRLPWTQGKSTVSGTQQMLSELMRYNPGPGPVGKKVGREEALITALPSCRRGKRMPCYH